MPDEPRFTNAGGADNTSDFITPPSQSSDPLLTEEAVSGDLVALPAEPVAASESEQPVRFSNSGRSSSTRSPLRRRLSYGQGTQPKSGGVVASGSGATALNLAPKIKEGSLPSKISNFNTALSRATRLANRDGVQDELKEQLRVRAKEKLKDVATSAVKKGLKSAGKQATEQAVKTGTKLAAKTTVRAAEAAVDVGTAGLGLIINIFVEIALQLGFDDAFDGVAALAQAPPDIAKARQLFIRAGVKVIIGINVIVTALLAITVVGIIPALPLLVFLHVYALLYFVFPSVSAFNGFLKWEIFVLALVDIFVLIVFVVVAAATLYYVCSSSGLNTAAGQAAAAAATYVGISDIAGQLGAVCAALPQ